MLIKNRLRHERIKFVSFKEVADIYLINTCSVTNNADTQSRQLIRRAKRLAPDSVVIVTGCYAHVARETLEQFPGVDYLFDNKEKDQIVDKIALLFQLEISPLEDNLLTDFENKTRPFLKIQDGCHSFCSYCVIPYARTVQHSMPPEDVVKQIKLFAQQGYREVVLTGIHLGYYGEDLEQKIDLVGLLQLLDQEKPIDRIRISSIDPHEITPEFIMLLKKSDVIQPHLHIALQYGEDTVLERMKRRDTVALVMEHLGNAKKEIPDLLYGFDIIIGFPGESDENFQSCYETVKALNPSYLHVFPYSKRPFTEAASFKEQVHGHIIKERSKEMRELGAELRRIRFQRELGRSYDVLFESIIKIDGVEYLQGHTGNFLPVIVAKETAEKHQIMTVSIEKIVGDYLSGSVASAHSLQRP